MSGCEPRLGAPLEAEDQNREDRRPGEDLQSTGSGAEEAERQELAPPAGPA